MSFYKKLMTKEAFFFRKSLEAKYKYLGNPKWNVNFKNIGSNGDSQKVFVVSAEGKNKYHAMDQNGNKISFKWNPSDASPKSRASDILMKIIKKRAKKSMEKKAESEYDIGNYTTKDGVLPGKNSPLTHYKVKNIKNYREMGYTTSGNPIVYNTKKKKLSSFNHEMGSFIPIKESFKSFSKKRDADSSYRKQLATMKK